MNDVTAFPGKSLLMKKILFVVNSSEFFLSHRLPIAVAAVDEGYEVHVASPGGSGAKQIKSKGLKHHNLVIERSGQNPFRELLLIASLYRLFRKLKPDLVHLITIKPVIYGGIAARAAGIKAVVAAVSGLGTVFMEESGFGAIRRSLVSGLYKISFSQKNLAVIFQNPNDRDALLDSGALELSQVRMIRGSGVDLTQYPCIPEPTGTPVVVMAARLLRDKGVVEFLEAAQILKARGISAIMRLIGSLDPGNPSSLSGSELEQWERRNVAEILGYRSDIGAQYAAAHIVCLPSYREGLPKGLVEAAACGRAVVTTDVPGCRDAIVPDKTGVLVSKKDSEALANAIQMLIECPGQRLSMGKAGRELAQNVFDIDIIKGQHMAIYKELLVG